MRRNDHDGIDDDEDLVSYAINDPLFDCISVSEQHHAPLIKSERTE